MKTNWQQEKEMSNAFWLKLIIRLALKLPRWIVRLLLPPIVFFFLLISAQKRQVSLHYLKQVLPYKPRIWHIYKHFYWFASTLLDRVYLLSGQTHLFKTSFINRHTIIDSFKNDPGQFFLSGHFGNIDAMRVQVDDKKYQIKPVIKLDHNQTITTLLNQLNKDFYNSIIPYEGLKTTFEIYENLKNDISIALLADRPIDNNNTLNVQFLNDTIPLPEGIFEMLIRFPFPANLIFSAYQGKNRYQIEYIPFIITPDDTPQSLAQKFADVLAKQCLKSPYNWFNFYTYWNSKTDV